MNPITVLMPVYNGERFLRPAMDSILTQTYGDFELLVLDDGSKDASVETVRSYRDERIRLCPLEHQGLISTLNAGLREARGEWIARMDCDDVALSDRLQRQWDYVSDYNDLVALGGAAEIIDAEGRRTGARSTPPADHELLVANLTFRGNGPSLIHPSVLMRSDAARQVGGYRMQFPVCEDADLWLRLARTGRLASLPEPVLLLRKHGENVSLLKLQVLTESSLAAAVCHAVREQTGIDPVDLLPEAWAACRARIHAEVEDGGLMRLKRTRQMFTERIRSRSPWAVLAAAGSLVVHPSDNRLFWCRQVCRKVIEKLSDELVEALQKKERSTW
jgi:hypothetical protein